MDTSSLTPKVVAAATVISTVAALAFVQKRNAATMESKGSSPPPPPALPDGIETGSFVNSRSQRIHTLSAHRKGGAGPPKATVVFFHGLCDHSSRAGYVRLYQALSAAGADVFALDHHGHGQSEGEPRGFCNSFDDYVDDAVDFVNSCRGETKGADPPLFLVGQSMGGLIAAFVALRLGSDGVAGIVLTSPACGVDMDLEKKIQLFFSPVINKVAPKARLVDAVRPVDLTRCTEEVEAFISDPLILKGKTPARTGIQISHAFGVLAEKKNEITCPLLLFHGTADKTTSINASVDFFRGVGTPLDKKMFVRVPGFYHEVYNEPERTMVLDMIATFVASGGKAFPENEEKDRDGDATDQIMDMDLIDMAKKISN